jgi:hypothetical protein
MSWRSSGQRKVRADAPAHSFRSHRFLGKGSLLNGASAYCGLFAYSGTTMIRNDESSADILRRCDAQFPVSISDAHNGLFALESWLAPVSSAETYTGDAYHLDESAGGASDACGVASTGTARSVTVLAPTRNAGGVL